MNNTEAGTSSSAGWDAGDASLNLARRLQVEEDAAYAAQLMAEDQRPARPASSVGPNSSSGHLPRAEPVSERLAAPAHKAVAHLGRSTAKRIGRELKVDLTVGKLLQLLGSPHRIHVLEMVDAGQRDRVEAECDALRIDLLPG